MWGIVNLTRGPAHRMHSGTWMRVAWGSACTGRRPWQRTRCSVRRQGKAVTARRNFSIVRTILERFPNFKNRTCPPDPCDPPSKAIDRFLIDLQTRQLLSCLACDLFIHAYPHAPAHDDRRICSAGNDPSRHTAPRRDRTDRGHCPRLGSPRDVLAQDHLATLSWWSGCIVSRKSWWCRSRTSGEHHHVAPRDRVHRGDPHTQRMHRRSRGMPSRPDVRSSFCLV